MYAIPTELVDSNIVPWCMINPTPATPTVVNKNHQPDGKTTEYIQTCNIKNIYKVIIPDQSLFWLWRFLNFYCLCSHFHLDFIRKRLVL